MTAAPSASDRIVTATKPKARGFASWKPDNESVATVVSVEDVLQTYAAYLPMTIRQVYYRLVAEGTVGKTEKDYRRLCDKINRGKRAGRLDWDAFRDDGVIRTQPPGYESQAEIEAVLDFVMAAGINRMVWQSTLQIVYCEAGGMVPMLESVANDYGAAVWSASGFDGSQVRYNLAQLIAKAGKPVIVHHVGDYDPSGLHIFQSLADDVEAFGLVLGGSVTFKRVAITPEQITRHQLPEAPAKSTDTRSFDGTGTVQAEALPPDVLTDLVRDALEQYFDHGADADGRAKSAEIVKAVARKYGGAT